MESDSSLEASFYNSIDKIDEIAINDDNLNEKIEYYKQERAEKVDEVSSEQNESAEQEQLEKDFENDMVNFNSHLNEVQATLSPIIVALSEGSDVGQESYTSMLSKLNETIQLLKICKTILK